MIVFNLYALVVALIAGLLYGGLSFVAPSVTDGAYGDLTLGVIVLVVGIGTELFGIKGRVFWLPMWFWGIVVTGFELYGHFGWWGPAGAAVVAVAAFGLLMFWAYRGEKVEWAEAPGKLQMARASHQAGATDAMWEQLEAAFFDPAFHTLTPQMAAHNRATLAMLREVLGYGLTPQHAQVLAALDACYARVEAGEEGVDIEQDHVDTASALIEHQGNPPLDDDEQPSPRQAYPHQQYLQQHAHPQQHGYQQHAQPEWNGGHLQPQQPQPQHPQPGHPQPGQPYPPQG